MVDLVLARAEPVPTLGRREVSPLVRRGTAGGVPRERGRRKETEEGGPSAGGWRGSCRESRRHRPPGPGAATVCARLLRAQALQGFKGGIARDAQNRRLWPRSLHLPEEQPEAHNGELFARDHPAAGRQGGEKASKWRARTGPAHARWGSLRPCDPEFHGLGRDHRLCRRGESGGGTCTIKRAGSSVESFAMIRLPSVRGGMFRLLKRLGRGRPALSTVDVGRLAGRHTRFWRREQHRYPRFKSQFGLQVSEGWPARHHRQLRMGAQALACSEVLSTEEWGRRSRVLKRAAVAAAPQPKKRLCCSRGRI
ncbi:uncharacterized protein LOC118887387 [Balaenoptera musculus]|uniref:Uncharacterized protein LOC118887387 n=1 Tax=Balaenoptera musculus TaxID=9771 RepID=A0A8B8WC08_BALMU|nr:uncharacterized protein LOC118887387 [Balaenoptera musculus]